MSEIDFEIIESNQIESSRTRRPKYKHKVWEYDNPKDEARYMLAIARMHERQGSEYAQELRSKISSRIAYEIEMETVFPAYIEHGVDIEDDEDYEISEDEVFTLSEDLNSIVDIPLGNKVVVLTPFVYDPVTNRITCRVPAGVVTKKMDLKDLIVVVFDYIEKAPQERLSLLFDWIEVARATIEELKEFTYIG